MSPATYPPVNTSIGETKEWRMRLNREPGHLQVTLQVPRSGTTLITLFPAQRFGEGPIRISFAGTDCATGPEAHIKFYTSTTESHFKYFRAPLMWEKEVTVSIDWDHKALTSISVNKETITVQPYIDFEEIQISNHSEESIKIKELRYTPSQNITTMNVTSTATTISTAAQQVGRTQ